MKYLVSTMSLLVVFIFASGFTSNKRVEKKNVTAKSQIIKGRIGVGKARGYACQLKIFPEAKSGFYSSIFTVEFSYVNKARNAQGKNKLYSMKDYFNIQQYGKDQSFFGRKINEKLSVNQQPTTLQFFKDDKSNSFKAVYFNGSYIVCDRMLISL